MAIPSDRARRRQDAIAFPSTLRVAHFDDMGRRSTAQRLPDEIEDPERFYQHGWHSTIPKVSHFLLKITEGKNTQRRIRS